ncbi:MAG: sodium/glutamate symporter [Candidatus Cloacimonadota bacterium]|nr:MAG: sodium/glutamate symporter [Candidatus Cloacimonadota bacterium]
MQIHLDLVQTGGLSVLVLFIGYFFNRSFSFLKKNNIPEPVVGGIVFALATTILYKYFNFQFSFDMSLKNPLMLTFFTTVGLGASFKLLIKGGPKVLLFLALAGFYLIIQNGIGVLLAHFTDLHPLMGLIGGSITLAGGHGTGATYAEIFSNTQNLQAAMELAMACATFGLVLGGLIGGPVAQRLIAKNNLESSEKSTDNKDGRSNPDTITYDPRDEDHVTPLKVMETFLVIAICIVFGDMLYQFLQSINIQAPSFICSLFIGIILTNICEYTHVYEINKECVDLCGTIGLSMFLAMALMSLRLWELMNLAGPILVILLAQTIILALFAYFVTFRVMGSDYDAAIIAGGHCGFGMGATPTAVANMEALTSRYGPSSQAFLVVPMVGAFFIDIANAFVLTTYIGFMGF